MTFDQWWYDFRIKNGIREQSERSRMIALAAWEAGGAQDARRYRWLRDAHDCDWNRLLRDGGEQMDANIDTEIAKCLAP